MPCFNPYPRKPKEIAAVASYVRSAWGNQAGAVTEEIVAGQR